LAGILGRLLSIVPRLVAFCTYRSLTLVTLKLATAKMRTAVLKQPG
jgi:hypothetical protein